MVFGIVYNIILALKIVIKKKKPVQDKVLLADLLNGRVPMNVWRVGPLQDCIGKLSNLKFKVVLDIPAVVMLDSASLFAPEKDSGNPKLVPVVEFGFRAIMPLEEYLYEDVKTKYDFQDDSDPSIDKATDEAIDEDIAIHLATKLKTNHDKALKGEGEGEGEADGKGIVSNDVFENNGPIGTDAKKDNIEVQIKDSNEKHSRTNLEGFSEVSGEDDSENEEDPL
ncbi:hypothetical protein GIB67_030689 [Kingdonia uniflora]|uniref:Uncharacterized protein n=1 Tax=Kingdonia uniflora TaxID=39325 RepID=A0A7J7NIK4_9MAGN|nr:hypothetical protein GIB67_030689 [Kingdonia uniflora]